MKCPNCGEMLPVGAKFCGACGSEIAETFNMDAAKPAAEKANKVSPEAKDIPAGSVQNSLDPDVPQTQTGQSAADKSGKNNVLPILLIAVIVVVIVAVNVVFTMMPTEEERWQEQYDLGQQYLLELDYEQAIVAFTAAIEIDENDSSAWIGRAQSYYGLGVQEMEATAGMDEEDDFSEAAQEYMSSALNDYDMALTLGDMQPDIYIGMGNVYVALGNYEEAVSILETGIQENPEDAAISERLSEVTTALQIQVLQQEHWDTVMTLINAVLEEPLNIGVVDWYGDAFDTFLSGLDGEIFCELESGWYLGGYPSGYIYYGEMENGQRSGEGYWIDAGGYLQGSLDSLEDKNYLCTNCIYYGKWSEDYPNGWGQYTEFYVDNTGELHDSETFEMNFTNGCPDGTGTFIRITSDISESCEIQAENGYFVKLYGDYENGYGTYAITSDVYFDTSGDEQLHCVSGACILSEDTAFGDT